MVCTIGKKLAFASKVLGKCHHRQLFVGFRPSIIAYKEKSSSLENQNLTRIKSDILPIMENVEKESGLQNANTFSYIRTILHQIACKQNMLYKNHMDINVVLNKLSEANKIYCNDLNELSKWYHGIISLYNRSNKVEDANRVCSLYIEMKEKGIIPSKSISLDILHACTVIWNEEIIFELLNQIKNEEYEKDCISFVIQNPINVSSFKKKLKQYVYDQYQIYNRLEKLCRNGKTTKILLIIEELKRTGIKADTHCYHLVLSSLVYNGNAHLVSSTFENFMACNNFIPNEKTMNTIISACWKSKSYDQANNYYNQFRFKYNIKPDTETINVMLRYYYRTNKGIEGIEFLNKFVNKGGNCNIYTYEVLFDIYCSLHQYEKILNIWNIDDINKIARSSNILCHLLYASGKLKDIKSCHYYINCFKSYGIDIPYQAYDRVFDAYINANELDKVMDYFKEIYYSNNDISPSIYAITNLMNTFLSTKKYDDVLKLFFHFYNSKDYEFFLQSKHNYSMIFILAMDAFEQLHSWKEIVDLFYRLPLNSFRLPVKRYFYKKLILTYEKLGMWQEAIDAYDIMRKSQLGDDSESYKAIVRTVAMCGKAMESLDYQGGDWYRSYLYGNDNEISNE